MSLLQAWRDGIRRVVSAPAIVVAVWVMTALFTLPLALALRTGIANDLGHSLSADAAARGMNYEWMQEFADQATGLGTTFRPTIVGFAAVLDNLSALMDSVRRPAAVAGASAAYVLLWLFLAGGIIDRYARDHATRVSGFFSACRMFFFRFIRLAIVMAVVYGLLFGALHPWMFNTVYPRLVRDVDVERTAFMIRAGLYLIFGLLLAGANVVFDYAKVRTVVEDRHSALVAIIASLRFIRDNAATALGVYMMNVVLFALVLAAYAFIAPSTGGIGIMVWAAFVIGQAYIAGRLCVKLLFWASETALFQNRLAHAGYVASATPRWPDSASAEARRKRVKWWSHEHRRTRS